MADVASLKPLLAQLGHHAPTEEAMNAWLGRFAGRSAPADATPPALLRTAQAAQAWSEHEPGQGREDHLATAALFLAACVWRQAGTTPMLALPFPSQEIQALLGARKQLQIKVIDLEQTVRGLLRGFGLKVGDVSRGKLPARIRELAAGHVMLEKIVEPLLAAREAMWREFAKLHREVLMIV